MNTLKKFSEFYMPEKTLKDVFVLLCAKGLSVEKDSDKIDVLTLNFVLKYLFSYLNIEESDELEEIVSNLEIAIKNHKEYDLEITDNFAIQCLAHIKATAAVFREIAFSHILKDEKGENIILDLGSGSGVLCPPAVIALKRAGFENIIYKGYEKQKIAVENSTRVLNLLSDDSLFIEVFEEDILKESFYTSLESEVNNIRVCITETFMDTTVPLIIKDKKVFFRNEEDLHEEENNAKWGDPFGLVMKNILDTWDDFYDNVEDQKTLLFPNIIEGSFQPGQETLLLKNVYDSPQKLDCIGEKYNSYQLPETNSYRW